MFLSSSIFFFINQNLFLRSNIYITGFHSQRYVYNSGSIFVSNCLFYKISSTLDGGTLHLSNIETLNILESSFLEVLSDVRGAAIMAFNCGQSLLSKCCGRSCIAKWACFCDISVSNSNNQNSGNLVSIYNCTGKSLDDSYNVVEIEGGNQTFHSWNSSFCYTKDTCAFYVENTLSSTIKWATFSSNKANRGSVLNSWNSSLSYSYSNIYNNTETFRGLFLLPQTTLTLNNCIFINNNVKQLFSNQAIDGASHPYQLNVFNCIWPSNLNTGLNFQSSSNNLDRKSVV